MCVCCVCVCCVLCVWAVRVCVLCVLCAVCVCCVCVLYARRGARVMIYVGNTALNNPVRSTHGGGGQANTGGGFGAGVCGGEVEGVSLSLSYLPNLELFAASVSAIFPWYFVPGTPKKTIFIFPHPDVWVQLPRWIPVAPPLPPTTTVLQQGTDVRGKSKIN